MCVKQRSYQGLNRLVDCCPLTLPWAFRRFLQLGPLMHLAAWFYGDLMFWRLVFWRLVFCRLGVLARTGSCLMWKSGGFSRAI